VGRPLIWRIPDAIRAQATRRNQQIPPGLWRFFAGRAGRGGGSQGGGADPAPGFQDETPQLGDRGDGGLREIAGGPGNASAGCEDPGEGAADRASFLGGEACPSHPDRVGGPEAQRIASRDDGEGGDIAGDDGSAGRQGEAPDSAELVHAGESGKIGVVSHPDVAAQNTMVHQNRIVLHDDVVARMRSGHHQDPFPEDGFVPFSRGPVDGDMLVEAAAFPDADQGPLPCVGRVLGFTTEDGPGSNYAAVPQDRAAKKVDVGLQAASPADLHARFHHAKRADLAPRPDLGAGMDHRGRVDEDGILSPAHWRKP